MSFAWDVYGIHLQASNSQIENEVAIEFAGIAVKLIVSFDKRELKNVSI